MGLRAKLRSTGKGAMLAKAFAATNLVSYKTGAGGGQAIFGVKKQVTYVRETLGISIHPRVETAYMAIVVTFTLITSVLTRGGNTFRQIFGKNYLYTLGILKAAPVEEEAPPVQVIVEPPAEPEIEKEPDAEIILLDDEDEEADLEDELKHEPANILIDDDEEEEEKEESEEDDDEDIIDVIIDPPIQPSTLRLGLQMTIDSFISACSLTSTVFTTINSYNFGINFMGYVESIDPNTKETSDSVTSGMLALLEIGALAMTIGNFYSNFYYNSAKARAYGFRFANWITNLECVDVASDVILLQLDPDEQELPPAKMKEAENNKTPILIKQADQFFIFGCQDSSWEIIKVRNITPEEHKALEKLDFKKPRIEMKDLYEPMFSVVKRGHNFNTTLIKTDYSHLKDAWSYRYAIGLTFINFSFSEPANAFFTTMNSIVVVPGVTAIFAEDTLQTISAFSTATSVVQNISTNVPSVKNLLHPDPEVKAALDRLPDSSRYLLRFGQVCGAEDSLITAFSYFIAILYTLNKLNPSISLTDPTAMLVAGFCGGIKGLSNQGFSVNPALIDLMEDMHPNIFKEEREKAKIARDQAKALKVVKAADIQILPGSMKKQPVVEVEMQSSNHKKKRAKHLGDDLHELLLSGDEEQLADDSGSEDENSAYQAPSLSRGAGLLTAKSFPNLHQGDHPSRSSQKNKLSQMTYSPQRVLQSASALPPLDFYNGIHVQNTNHSRIGTPQQVRLKPSSSAKKLNARGNEPSGNEFEEKKHASSSSVKRIFSHFAAGNNDVVAASQSEPIRKNQGTPVKRPVIKQQAPAHRIVHSSQKTGLFEPASSSSRKMPASVDLEKIYGRTSFQLY